MRTPLGTISSYDGPGENQSPPRLLLAMGHPAELADATLNLFRVIVNGALSVRDRKLATLAIAAELRNSYEWGHHVVTAVEMGISTADLDAIKTGDNDRLANRDRIIVELSRAVERQDMTDKLWSEAAEVLPTEQLVQITVVSAYYGMLARVQSTLQVDQDEGFAHSD